ncbi:hypothetical protein M378DRAFT_184790 [Amanita muscaria Koide BX008]|uniref:RING-type E3 ubiquitin transferase n=1 Tax=Amanita muscaria (strain Koide BX008) TaxID=946122 RepID=A0A0C2XIX0_AMAMK|nr:hypothetical protein M378DRAFT_184790 [Amanita muscaria Koide BX008]
MFSLNAHRILVYSLLSFSAVSFTILGALRSYSNFYSVAIYLSKSSRSVLVLANFGFLVALLSGHLVQRLFFGVLRPIEVERLYDRLWFFITESLLAFTIFRDEFDIPFALMFGFLLFVKSFHWLASDRIEWMDQVPYPGPPLLFHIRMSTLFAIMWLTDCIMFLIAVESTLAHGVGGMVLFASEYGILVASVMNTVSKYVLSVYDLRRAGRLGGENAPPWENKSMWVFYIELATDFLKLTTYLIFFLIIIAFYGLPLNIVRDVYITARSFITRLRALHRYQTATRNMDQRYPNATAEELVAMNDRTCIICREEMIIRDPTQATVREGPNVTPKKLPCGHVFHFHCLRSWLERQQSCPTCRRTVLESPANDRNPAVNQPQGPGGNAPAAAPAGNGQGNNNVPGRVPLGFLGRFFAPPPQGRNAPQVANNNAGGGGNAANVGGQMPQEVLIQYHIQYQTQRQQARPSEPLRPVPQFQGFNRPGGAWQPWAGVENRNQAAAGNGGDNNQRTAEEAMPGAPATEEQGDAGSAAQDPRAAAAAAALRRLGGAEPSQTDVNNNTASSSSTPARETINTQRSALPELVPLYDLNRNIRREASSSIRRDNRDGPRLPPTLTEEQLAIMDRLTREAIDERLRVLEGVSTAINRCVDDLMRMRSALPVSSAPGIPPAGAPTEAANHNGGDEA